MISLDGDDGQLQHLARESVSAEFLGDAEHHQLVGKRRDQERQEHGERTRHVCAADAVNVALEEAVDGNVPLTRELKPVCAVPPVRIEVAVGEAGDLGESSKDVFEDYKKDWREESIGIVPLPTRVEVTYRGERSP
jgi:hypothetical protein